MAAEVWDAAWASQVDVFSLTTPDQAWSQMKQRSALAQGGFDAVLFQLSSSKKHAGAVLVGAAPIKCSLCSVLHCQRVRAWFAAQKTGMKW